jgi:HrpA-like RNA helicase
LGDEVGYVIRFDDNTSPKTRLRYVTDGILVREACFDPTLSAYDVIVIDEAHERSLETDLLLGLIKNIQKKRKDLRVVIMSATLNVDKFSIYFNDCPIFTIPGRLYDVDVVHHSSRTISQLKYSHVEKAVDTAIYIHLHEEPGDILVFLTGRSDIEMAIKLFEKEMDRIEMEDPRALPDLEPRVYPIYAALDTLEQKEIFRVIPKRFRKIVFATNIAQVLYSILI